MTDYKAKTIMLLANGFKEDFKNFVLEDDEFQDLIGKLADEFVADNIPLVDTDNKSDLASELIQSVKLIAEL